MAEELEQGMENIDENTKEDIKAATKQMEEAVKQQLKDAGIKLQSKFLFYLLDHWILSSLESRMWIGLKKPRVELKNLFNKSYFLYQRRNCCCINIF